MVALPVALAAITAFLTLWALLRWNASRLPLPPGPRRTFLIGNLLDWPSNSKEWETFAEWHKRYGDLVSASVLGRTMIIINSFEVADALLNQKGSIYSDRPILPMATELVGWDRTIALLRNGDRHRYYRSLYQRVMGTHEAVQKYHALIEDETRHSMRRILSQHEPGDILKHLRIAASRTILKITYGYTAKESGDPIITIASLAMDRFMKMLTPGAYPVDLIPALKYVPNWMPGTGFKKLARQWATELEQIADLPYDTAEGLIRDGKASPCMVQEYIHDTMSDEERYRLKWAASSLFLAGSDTTDSALQFSFFALAMNPAVLSRMQREMDTAIGGSRLPCLDDRDKLPYTNAVAMEIFRFNSVTPSGVPHVSSEDDSYDGYFIPANSILIANLESMLHDPNTYQDPYVFDPTRFLPELSGRPAERDPQTIGFGFGRRRCAGNKIADASIFITTAMAAAAFDIGAPTEGEKATLPAYEKLPGAVSHPKPFKITIKARSAKVVDLLNAGD